MNASDIQDPGPRAPRPAASGRITLSLTPAAVGGSAVLLCLGFVAVFALGIIIGRGHTPEAGIPELARIMPEAAPTTAPVVIAADDAPAPPARDPLAPQSAPPRNTVIEQGDLGYRDNLKTPARPETTPSAGKPSPPKTPAKAEGKAGAKPEGKPAQARPQNPEPAKTPPAQKTATAPVKSADTRVYQYVYQAASFKDEPSSRQYAAKLNAAGFKARYEKLETDGKVWYRVLVDFTGKPDDTDALREKLKGFGVPKALLRSKTPAQ